MAENESGFTVHDRRRVKLEGEDAETKGERPEPDTDRAPAGASLPPVDFAGFVLGLGQMALVHLGEVPEPVSGTTVRDFEQARQTIDILSMIEEKTRGNLTSGEADLLRHLLSELKLTYVRLKK